jgi:hypothetical protein
MAGGYHGCIVMDCYAIECRKITGIRLRNRTRASSGSSSHAAADII